MLADDLGGELSLLRGQLEFRECRADHLGQLLAVAFSNADLLLCNPGVEGHLRVASEALSSTLASAISPKGRTGWSRVDEEIAELKRHFALARTPQDYRNIGNDCVIVLEALSRQVYDSDLHLRDGEEEPPVAKTKTRIDRFIEDAAPGAENAALRKLAKAANDQAQAVKHRAAGNRKEAGIAADSVVLLANILRRLDEDD